MAETIEKQRQFPCRQCGAVLRFEPGQNALKCPYCQAENDIPASAEVVREEDFRAALALLRDTQQTVEILTVHCTACGAESNLPQNVTADLCPFCGAAIVAHATSRRILKPKALLPFGVKREEAMHSFRVWIASRWFAPSDLKRYAEAGSLKGAYIPYWTYDCDTDSHYSGQRGDDYWDTEHYTTTVNGRTEHRTRRVRKTRWTYVSGQVYNTFDDVLVVASTTLPTKYVEMLEPWDLNNLVPYSDEYLAGFVAESYQVDLVDGFEGAKEIMSPVIRQTICRDIGGDHQRIHSVQTGYHDITFKHILLPLWISAYRYRQRTFRFLVNARTGEVCGERPYSAWKITLLILAILLAVGIAFWIYNNR